MDLVPAGTELPNDPDDNPCFACGPRNPLGLRMRFFDDGKVVRSTLTLDERHGGSHAHVLAGIVFGAMEEALYWRAWARFGEHARSATQGPSLLLFTHDVLVDKPFVVEAEVVADHGDVKDLRARVVQGGGECARLGWTYRRQTRDEIERMLKRADLERSTREEYARMLASRA